MAGRRMLDPQITHRGIAMTDGDQSVTKRAPVLSVPAYLSEHMKIERLVEALERLSFNSRDEGKIVVDRVTRNYLMHAAHAAGDPDLTVHQALARRGTVRR
jgi:hypothetical protein